MRNTQCLYNQQKTTLLCLIDAIGLHVPYNDCTINFLSASTGLTMDQVKFAVDGWSNDGLIEFRNMPGSFSLHVDHSHWLYKNICGMG